MAKNNIWILIAVIAAVVLAFLFYPRGQGYITVDTKNAVIQLRSSWFNRIKITSGTKPYPVNARVYKPHSLSIAMKQDRDTWRIYSYGPWGKLAKINVKKNETTIVKFGPPFIIKQRVEASRSNVNITFFIVGKANEYYKHNITKNGRRLPTPRFKIVDESGKILHSDKFKYG